MYGSPVATVAVVIEEEKRVGGGTSSLTFVSAGEGGACKEKEMDMNHGNESYDTDDDMDILKDDGHVILCSAYDDSTRTLAVALSDFRILLFENKRISETVAVAPRAQLLFKGDLRGLEDRVNDFVFHASGTSLISVSNDGHVVGWNLKTRSPTFRFRTDSPSRSVNIAPLSSPCVVVGLEDGSIEFWDISSGPRKVGTYDSSHAEAVTQIMFHPRQKQCMITASEDGLLCVFNISASCEDDALLSIANANSSIHKFGLFGPHLNCAWCLTATETLALWRIDADCDEIAEFEDARSLAHKSCGVEIDYFLECFTEPETNSLLLLGGDHTGKLHLFSVTPQGLALAFSLPASRYSHSSTVRCVAISNDSLMTGADDGILCVWPRALRGIDKCGTGTSSDSSSSSRSSSGSGSGSRGAGGVHGGCSGRASGEVAPSDAPQGGARRMKGHRTHRHRPY